MISSRSNIRVNTQRSCLDTAERKITEYLDNRLNSYSKELEIIEKKLKFKMK